MVSAALRADRRNASRRVSTKSRRSPWHASAQSNARLPRSRSRAARRGGETSGPGRRGSESWEWHRAAARPSTAPKPSLPSDARLLSGQPAASSARRGLPDVSWPDCRHSACSREHRGTSHCPQRPQQAQARRQLMLGANGRDQDACPGVELQRQLSGHDTAERYAANDRVFAGLPINGQPPGIV